MTDPNPQGPNMTNARDVIEEAHTVLRTTSVTHTLSHGLVITRMLGDENTRAILTVLHAANLAVVPMVATEEMVDAFDKSMMQFIGDLRNSRERKRESLTAAIVAATKEQKR